MISKRVQGFTESVIREMTRVNNQYDGINLAQGMPNFPPPRELVEAATLGGARALGRDDLGRIAPGAKADLVLWRATSWRMTPLRDPIKNIVYNAADEDVDRVYVDGRLVVDGGRVLAADEGAILAALQASGERMWPRMAKSDWAGRSADQLSPQTYADWDA